MAIAFTDYAKIKDNVCISYQGYCTEYLIQLLYIRQAIEKELPGINIFLVSKDNFYHLLCEHKNTLDYSTLKSSKNKFAYIRELTCNMRDHPVMQLITESELTLKYLEPPSQKEITKKCVLISKGIQPTNSLTVAQERELVKKYQHKGYTVELDGSLNGAGHVVGVESEKLFLAAVKGIKTTLIPTGLGTKLYKKLFPSNDFFELE